MLPEPVYVLASSYIRYITRFHLTCLQARAGGDFSRAFNEQKRRTLQRTLEHLLLFTPEADLPAAFQRAKPRRQGTASAGDASGPGAVLQPTVTLRCACQETLTPLRHHGRALATNYGCLEG